MIKGTFINLIYSILYYIDGKRNNNFANNSSLSNGDYQFKPELSIKEYYANKFIKDIRFVGGGKILELEGSCLRNLQKNSNESYDTVVLHDSLNLALDYEALVRESFRILKKKGVFITTLCSISLTFEKEKGLWGFTEASCKFIFGKYFNSKNILIKGYGNVLTGRYLLAKRSVNELEEKKLNYYDPYFTVVIGVRAEK